MKYDKPVWQIMHSCADAMPEVFRYDHVRAWFDVHYPNVNEATIRAHLIGLTEGGRAKHVQFAQRSPVFRRLARGEYEAIPVNERGEHPGTTQPSAARLKMRSSSVSGGASGPGDAGTAPTGGRRTFGPDGAGEVGSEPVAPSGAGALGQRARGLSRAADDVTTSAPDVILLGSVGERVNVPAPAKEVFREVSFQLSRLDAEQSSTPWFILSAEHGLVAPNEWMSPDSRTIADMDPDFRVMWAGWVVARLRSLVGPIKGLHIRIDAPDAFTGALFAHLKDTGAVVTSRHVGAQVALVPEPDGDAGGGAGTTGVDNTAVTRTAPVAAVAPAEQETPSVQSPPMQQSAVQARATLELRTLDITTSRRAAPLFLTPSRAKESQVLPIRPESLTTRAGQYLADPANALSLDDLPALPDSPGLYGWFVDADGAQELNECLMLPVSAGLIFVGQVGGSSWQMRADPVLNLRHHIERIQLHGRSRSSTFRMTLATVLRDHLKMSSVDDPSLTTWMTDHLRVAVWATDNFGALRELERVVVSELDPPLNVDHPPAGEYRARLTQMRRALA